MTTIDIIDIKELVGRTITEASIWSDMDSMSLKLDNGAILQIVARMTVNADPFIGYEIELPPPPMPAKDLVAEGTNEDGTMSPWGTKPPFAVFSIKAQDHVFFNLDSMEAAERLAEFYDGLPVQTGKGVIK